MIENQNQSWMNAQLYNLGVKLNYIKQIINY